MLIIGHRGAAGLAAQNTLAALRAGLDAGADILEFDVRLTSDNIPVLAHDPILSGKWISRTPYAELKKASPLLATLQEALDEFFGRILLNIELKTIHSSRVVYQTVAQYVIRPDDWDNVIFSSFKPKALHRLNERDTSLNLALLHHANPFSFMLHHKKLRLSAVGFHRLNANPLALAVAKELGIFTYVYTVDRPSAAIRFARKNVGAVVTNFPDKIGEALRKESFES